MIKQNYKGRDISFDEHSEDWTCDDLGLVNKSLKSIKSSIDRADKKDRTMAIPALYLDEAYYRENPTKLFECVITLLRTDRRPKANIKIKGQKSVEQVDLYNLYPIAHKEKLQAYVAVKNRIAAEEKGATVLKEGLDAFTVESVRDAVVQQADEAA